MFFQEEMFQAIGRKLQLVRDLRRGIEKDEFIEITESVVMDNPTTTVHLLEAFQEGGIQLSIDDFGTGYSSLSYLQQFPVDTLKIDRAFVNLLDAGEQNVEIIRAIVQLGQVLGMTITAEGIEKVSHLEILRELGCEYGQGYFFAKPMAAEAVFSYLGLTEKSASL